MNFKVEQPFQDDAVFFGACLVSLRKTRRDSFSIDEEDKDNLEQLVLILRNYSTVDMLPNKVFGFFRSISAMSSSRKFNRYFVYAEFF